MIPAMAVEQLRRFLHLYVRGVRERGAMGDVPEDLQFVTFAAGMWRAGTAQLSQDAWVLFETRQKQGGFYVEFGAGDGMQLSNTYVLEKRYGWKGILAEPNPVFHDRLRGNRGAYVSTKCIAGASGETVQFVNTTDPHFSTMERYVACDLHAQLRATGARVSVETQSLTDLLEEAHAPAVIDYLSIDTEGSELEILKAHDFGKYRFRLITVEHNHAPNRAAIHDLLVSRGYRRKFKHLSDFEDWYVYVGPAAAKLAVASATVATKKAS